MRFAVNLDKLEEGLNRRRSDGKFGQLMFPPGPTLPTDIVTMSAVLQHALVFPTAFCLLLPLLFIALSFIITADLSLRLYQQVRPSYIYKITLLVLNDLAQGLPIIFLSLLVFNIAINLLQRWAWNRRADRLNREASLPQPALTSDMGVWPPPPSVSASADAPPRL